MKKCEKLDKILQKINRIGYDMTFQSIVEFIEQEKQTAVNQYKEELKRWVEEVKYDKEYDEKMELKIFGEIHERKWCIECSKRISKEILNEIRK